MSTGASKVRVALVGAACTGKTTAFEAARAAGGADGLRVHWLEEVARRVIRQERAAAPTDAALQVRILQRVLEVEAALPEADLVVSDRCALDAIVYLHALGETRQAAALLEEHEQAVRRVTRFLLFDPAGVPYLDDADRHDGVAFREAVHRSFEATLSRLSVDVTFVTGDPAARTAAVRSAMASAVTAAARPT